MLCSHQVLGRELLEVYVEGELGEDNVEDENYEVFLSQIKKNFPACLCAQEMCTYAVMNKAYPTVPALLYSSII